MTLHHIEQPLSKAQREELKGIVATSTQVVRGALFFVTMGFVGLLARTLQHAIVPSPPLWIIPTFLVGLWLYRRARNWTGGPELRRAAAKDLAGGVMQITVIETESAVMIEELEDEGPTYFVTATSGEIVLFTGQEMSRYQRKLFPWSKIGVQQTPHAKQCFAPQRMGEPHTVDAVMAPLPYETAKAFECFDENFVVLNARQRTVLCSVEDSPFKSSGNSSPSIT